MTKPPSPRRSGTIPKRRQKSIHFLDMSITRLIVLLLLTFGLYSLYWTYKNWKNIGESLPKTEKIYPFWRTFFGLFFTFSLFEQIELSAKQAGFKKEYRVGALALVYILSGFIANGLSRISDFNIWVSVAAIFLAIVGAIPLIFMQKAINFNNSKLRAARYKEQKTTTPEIVFIMIATIVGILSYVAYLVPIPSTPALSADIQAEAAQKREYADSLADGYRECSANLVIQQREAVQQNKPFLNADGTVPTCEDVRIRQNQAADEYNNFIKQYQ